MRYQERAAGWAGTVIGNKMEKDTGEGKVYINKLVTAGMRRLSAPLPRAAGQPQPDASSPRYGPAP